MSLADQIQSYLSIIMNAVSHLVKESIPAYLHNLPVPDSILGWFSLSISDWARLVPFGVAVGGLSYLSLQVVIIKIAILLYQLRLTIPGPCQRPRCWSGNQGEADQNEGSWHEAQQM